MMIRLGSLATTLGAKLVPGRGESDVDAVARHEVQGVAPLGAATPVQVSFLANPEYARYLPSTKAGAVIVAAAAEDCAAPQLVHPNPYWAFAKTAQLFFRPERLPVGVSPGAVVERGAVVGRDAAIAAGARLGDRVTLYPGVYVGRDAAIGDDTVLRANVVVEHEAVVGARVLIHANSVIGADGFGFAPGAGGIEKIPQTGGVVVGDDVEIGANCSVDRGAMADTVIGAGTKLDSHVHVGHNVVVGRHCMLCGMVALAGSAKLGDWVVVAGLSGVNNHVEICSHTTVGAMSGVTKSVREKGVYLGFPAQPAGAWRRQEARVRRLPELEAKVKELEGQLSELRTALEKS
jgi:UDP-3-O-[3-hydroxymyristoyl] glucosamine N-acyltransferase